MSRLESQEFKRNVSGEENPIKSEKNNAVLTENFNVRFSKELKEEIESLTGKGEPFYTQSALVRHCVREQLGEVKR